MKTFRHSHGTRPWTLGLALALALALATPVARGGYLDPAAFDSLGAAPDGGSGTIHPDSGTFVGWNSGATAHGVLFGDILVFTFDSLPRLDISVSLGYPTDYKIAILSKSDLVSFGSSFGFAGSYGSSGMIPTNGQGGGDGGGASGGSGGPGASGKQGGSFGSRGAGGALLGGGIRYDRAMGGGGGALELGAVGRLTVGGTINVSGGPGAGAYGRNFGAGGGGGGGSVTLVGERVEVTGQILAQGGGGGGGVSYGGPGGGGGGGFVSVVAGVGGVSLTGTIDVSGGRAQLSSDAPGLSYHGGGGGQGGTVLIRSDGDVNLLGTLNLAGGTGEFVGGNGFLVPEPAAGFLMGAGLLGLFVASLRRSALDRG